MFSRLVVAVGIGFVGLALGACGDGEGTSGDGGGVFDGGALADAGLAASRVQLRVRSRADLVARGTALLRLSILVDAPLSEANDRGAWTLAHGTTPLDLAGADLFVFPAVNDSTRAAVAVWLLPARTVRAGEMVTARLTGRDVFASTVATTDFLGHVAVQPVVVRDPAGGGPARTADEIAAQLGGFAPMVASACNLEVRVRTPVTVEVPGFAQLLELDIVSVDDAEIIALLREATGETVGLLLSERLDSLHDAADAVVGIDRGVVRAYVLGQHQSPEEASATTPSIFHTEVARLFGRDPYYLRDLPFYSHDPALPLLDESVTPPRIGQLLTRLSQPAMERQFALYFGNDHTEAFAHELGHILGLPHPEESSVIDAEDGAGGVSNVMSNASECLPGCALRISPHQCEIMLLGLTGFVQPT